MIKLKTILQLGLVLFYWSFAQSQDFRRDIERINATYQSAAQFHLEIDYNLYASHTTSKVYENVSALIYKDRNGYYSRMFEQETIINSEYVMLIDHESKLFMIDYFQIGQAQPKEQDLMSNEGLLDLLETMTNEAQTAIQAVERTGNKYVVVFNYGELEKMELAFNPSSFTFNKAILYYRDALPILENRPPQKPRLEINYRLFDTSPNIPPGLFSTDTYVSIIPDSALDPKGRMRNYTIINHLWTAVSQY